MSKDHYVSRFLLKQFVTKGKVWAYDKTTKLRIRRPTKYICCEEGFTTFSDQDVPPGMDGRFLEKELSNWERQQSLTISKILDERSIENIRMDDFYELVRFSVWLNLCNPANRSMIQEGWLKLKLLGIKNFTNHELDHLSLKYFKMILPHNYLREKLREAATKDDLFQSEFLDIILKSADSCTKIVWDNYAWSLVDLKDVNGTLCTSDRAVLLAGETLDGSVGFGLENALLFFPLSPNLCLTGKNVGKENRYILKKSFRADQKFLALPNILMWSKASRYIISANENDLPKPGMDIPSVIPSIIEDGNFILMKSV